MEVDPSQNIPTQGPSEGTNQKPGNIFTENRGFNLYCKLFKDFFSVSSHENYDTFANEAAPNPWKPFGDWVPSGIFVQL